MQIDRLSLADFRCIESLSLVPGAGLNAVLGPNGAGKTSVLEALYTLSRGHSFRRRAREGLIRRDQEALLIQAVVSGDDGRKRQVGISRSKQGWLARLDEADVDRIGDLFAVFAACAFTPSSHELLEGGAEERRSFADWGVFHVEPDFLDEWRRYSRALRQRNALLREQAADALFEPFEQLMAQSGERITAQRLAYLECLSNRLLIRAGELVPELGPCLLRPLPGYKSDTPGGLLQVLAEKRASDRHRGASTNGPHRSDWSISFDGLPAAGVLSRGQQKLAALALVLAQGDVHAASKGTWPVLLLDDLPSELDEPHQEKLLHCLEQTGMQVILSGTGWTGPLRAREQIMRVFHVEHGRLLDAAP